MKIWYQKYNSSERNLQVLQIPSGELCVSDDNNLSITLLRDLDGVTKVPDAAVNLDLVVEKLLERADVKDFVGGRLGCVDDELNTIFFSWPNLTVKTSQIIPTFCVTFSGFPPFLLFEAGFFYISKDTQPTDQKSSTSLRNKRDCDQQSVVESVYVRCWEPLRLVFLRMRKEVWISCAL